MPLRIAPRDAATACATRSDRYLTRARTIDAQATVSRRGRRVSTDEEDDDSASDDGDLPVASRPRNGELPIPMTITLPAWCYVPHMTLALSG